MPDLVDATRQPRRYLLVGVACAALHNAVMFGCDWIGINYLAALVISFAVLVPTGYVLHSLYTFERGISPRQFMRFTAGMLAGFAINLVLMIVLVSGIGLGVPPATLLATGLLFVWNFVSARWAILLHRGTREPLS